MPSETELQLHLGDDQERTIARSCLVTIQPGSSSKTPLFCVHAEAGDVSLYYGLASHLSFDHPVLGLCAPPAGVFRSRPRFAQLAALHVREITEAQPRGPYLILGECTGGVLAYEIARQLSSAGHDIALLAVIDGFAPGLPRLPSSMPRPAYRALHRTRILGFHLHNLARLDSDARLAYGTSKIRRAGRALSAKRPHIVHRSPTKESPPVAFREALASYSPQPYAGTLIVFRAATLPLGAQCPPELGWAELAADVEVETIPGYFSTAISEPEVRTLAERLSRRLNERHSEV